MRFRLLMIATALVAAGCSSDTDSTDNRESPRRAAAPPTPIAAAEVDEPTRTVKLGESLTLTGLDETEKVTVTVLAYRRGVEGADSDLDVPAAGNRFDAVQLHLETVGSTPYENAPSNDTRIVTTAGQFAAELAASTKAGKDFSDDDIKPGTSETGWVTFELRDSAKVTAVQFAVGVDGVGRWTVG